jgi:hypothetical protein
MHGSLWTKLVSPNFLSKILLSKVSKFLFELFLYVIQSTHNYCKIITYMQQKPDFINNVFNTQQKIYIKK